jgi:hypothetical protein
MEVTFTETLRQVRKARADWHSPTWFANDAPTWEWPAKVGRLNFATTVRNDEPIATLPATPDN